MLKYLLPRCSNTPLQLDLVPEVRIPRDALVRATTGTGKTFAYIIPAIESRLNYTGRAVIKASSPQIAARARASAGPLILAPTRELAVQIATDAQKLTTHQRDFQVQLLVGRTGRAQQIKGWMESSRDLVVATPGRLRDLLTNEPEFRKGFKNCPLLILDEADTLLSMGFRDDIDAIVSSLPRPPVRQTFLFSATMPRAVRQLASWILSPNHTFIDATLPGRDPTSRPDEENSSSAHDKPLDDLSTHEQFHTLCPSAGDQLPTILKLLAHDQLTHGSNSKVIVFCPTVQTSALFSTLLQSLVGDVLPNGPAKIVTMHSKMKQSDRNRSRMLFRKAGETQDAKPIVLVTSDISARGFDYPGVTRVIQIGIPSKDALYIHRIRNMARGIHPFASGQDQRPSARADLVLLPWEANYMDWHLTHLFIKPLPISTLDNQLTCLSSRLSTLTTEFLKSASAEVQRRIDPADVRGAAASLLGYYLPLSPSLRLQPNAVLAGVSTWASECFDTSLPVLTRFPRKFVEAYEQSTRSRKTKGLFVDGLKVAGPSPLGKSKSKNRSVWEGLDKRTKKPKRWY